MQIGLRKKHITPIRGYMLLVKVVWDNRLWVERIGHVSGIPVDFAEANDYATNLLEERG